MQNTLCALINNLNSEHLGRFLAGGQNLAENTAARVAMEQSKRRRGNIADVTGCEVCISKVLARAGPARFLVGRSVRDHAKQTECAPLCRQGSSGNVGAGRLDIT